MIYLTCDIHHAGLKTGNQEHCKISEIETATLMSKLLFERKIKATYFISGQSFDEEWDELKKFTKNPNISIGGHNYNCFKPDLLHRISNKFFDSYNGPKFYQKKDTIKTIDAIENKTGKKITLWRNHMYMHGKYTDEVLPKCGITICSDGVNKNTVGPYEVSSGYYHFPINIIPDHEHLIHAERTPEWISWWQNRYNWSDDFGPQSYYIEEWSNIVLSQLKENESKGIISNMIIHPITMYLCDEFKCLKKILDYIASCENSNYDELERKLIKKIAAA
jgi:hypothetical protein